MKTYLVFMFSLLGACKVSDPFPHMTVKQSFEALFTETCLKYEECQPESFLLDYSNLENCVSSALATTNRARDNVRTYCTVGGIKDCTNAIAAISCTDVSTPFGFTQPHMCTDCFNWRDKK